MKSFEKIMERIERRKKHREEIAKKVKLNESRSRQSNEYAKHRYSD